MTRSRETLTDYEMIHRDFSIDVPEYFNFGFDIVDRWAKKDRNKLALMWVNQKGEEKKFSFPDLSNPQNRKQIFFLKLGINNRDRVLVLLASIPEFVGKDDDVIKSSGYRIGPFEVESALIEHPSVREAAVVGSMDRIRWMIVKAFIVLNDGYEPSESMSRELKKDVKRTTAPYKYPREIEFVQDLPKTISGKIRRSDLRASELKKYVERQ